MAAEKPHVVIVSPGAKMGLTDALADAVSRRNGMLTAWERDPWSPALTRCSQRAGGGAIEDDDAAGVLLEWCVNNHVDLVVPTRHGDLAQLSRWRGRFIEAGVNIVVSDPECIRLTTDKVALHHWLLAQGYPAPLQTTVREHSSSSLRDGFPLIGKDPNGSGSRQTETVHTSEQVATLPPHWLLQTIAPGIEYTVNVYVDRHGTSVCEIPHQRIMVSEGEVVRARTARIPKLTAVAREIAETLPGSRGPLNIQMFLEERTQTLTVIEVNPRFGGGYPLAHRAGARFVDWLSAEYINNENLPRFEAWEDRLLMVRYRESLFISDTGKP